MKSLVLILALSSSAFAQDYVKQQCRESIERYETMIKRMTAEIEAFEKDLSVNLTTYKTGTYIKQIEMEAYIQNAFLNSEAVKNFTKEMNALTVQQQANFRSMLISRLESQIQGDIEKVAASGAAPKGLSAKAVNSMLMLEGRVFPSSQGTSSIRFSASGKIHYSKGAPILIISSGAWGPQGSNMTSGTKFIDLLSLQEIQTLDISVPYGGQRARTVLAEPISGELNAKKLSLEGERNFSRQTIEQCQEILAK